MSHRVAGEPVGSLAEEVDRARSGPFDRSGKPASRTLQVRDPGRLTVRYHSVHDAGRRQRITGIALVTTGKTWPIPTT